ncbi:MAG: pyridoxamine 5'-phosphate oxidase family protein [Lachnospiraceae bacterium]|jgi:nitroimidazol reductase NimA-like FMN-containing flavoprotein (pyridoxamine 5'-phosphate oxidase superfamily)|nr:pyridoxamine 5'-phosphate oxidase family protein [Lachnospiraceae bacterium]
MRKSNREIKEQEGLNAVLEKSGVCRLALNTPEGAPYIVPLNYGYEVSENGKLTLYFHCAKEGRKLDLIHKDSRCGFEMDCSHELETGELACQYTFYFESIIGTGMISIVEDNDERIHGLKVLMRHYGGEGKTIDERALALTTVLRLDAVSYCGKRHERKN